MTAIMSAPRAAVMAAERPTATLAVTERMQQMKQPTISLEGNRISIDGGCGNDQYIPDTSKQRDHSINSKEATEVQDDAEGTEDILQKTLSSVL